LTSAAVPPDPLIAFWMIASRNCAAGIVSFSVISISPKFWSAVR
jgi:hypothetical protein